MHPYAKAPPAFAKDPWAWDYTRDRMEENYGLTYDEWESKQFMGAAAMYKNVVKKYRANVDAQVFDLPRECVDCGDTSQHYVGDYVCSKCRDLLDAASTYEEAAKTITQPESVDAIREALYKALGHDKRDKAKGRPVGAPKVNPLGANGLAHLDNSPQITHYVPVDKSAPRQVVEQAVAVGGKVSRNYKAMKADKLKLVIAELEAGMDGDSNGSVARAAKKGESVMDHLEAALRAQVEVGS